MVLNKLSAAHQMLTFCSVLFRMVDQLGSELESKHRLEDNYIEKIKKLEKTLGRRERDFEVSLFYII